MTDQLRNALREVAVASPALAPPPTGMFDKARGAQRRRRAAATLATVFALAVLAYSTVLFPAGPTVVTASTAIPSYFVSPPKWTADVRDAPIERATMAFVMSNAREKLVIVGPDSAYRTYTIPTEGYSAWSPPFLLSPDGRQLMVARGQTTELLDLSTGKLRKLEIGAPLAWSRDGTQAVVVNEAANQLWVVQMPTGAVVWRMPLREGEKLVAAAFAPDLTKVVVQQGGNVTLHQPTGQVWDLEVSPALILPGPLAWTEDGSGIATTRLTPFTAFSVLDAGTGRPSADIAQQSGLNYLSPQGRSDGLPSVLGWHDGVPIVNAANRSIVHLNVPYNVLATAAEGTRELQLASIGTDWQAVDPGTPDPGPALQRYRPVVSVALPGLLVVVVLVGVLVRFLLPWLRPRRRA